MATFFVPAATDRAMSEKVWAVTARFAEDTTKYRVQPTRIQRIEFTHDGKDYVAEVGDEFSRNGELVFMIFETDGGPYLVCTFNRGLARGLPVYVGRHEVTNLVMFDPETPAAAAVGGPPERRMSVKLEAFATDSWPERETIDKLRIAWGIVAERKGERGDFVVATAKDVRATSAEDAARGIYRILWKFDLLRHQPDALVNAEVTDEADTRHSPSLDAIIRDL